MRSTQIPPHASDELLPAADDNQHGRPYRATTKSPPLTPPPESELRMTHRHPNRRTILATVIFAFGLAGTIIDPDGIVGVTLFGAAAAALFYLVARSVARLVRVVERPSVGLAPRRMAPVLQWRTIRRDRHRLRSPTRRDQPLRQQQHRTDQPNPQRRHISRRLRARRPDRTGRTRHRRPLGTKRLSRLRPRTGPRSPRLLPCAAAGWSAIVPSQPLVLSPEGGGNSAPAAASQGIEIGA